VSDEAPSRKKHWEREVIAEAMSKLGTERPVVSQRQLAEESGIPRSTLQHWLERRDTLNADPVVVVF
jgi:lambda repressor-like predicted transcriptional regulator